jgi:serine/threonine protein kinase/Tol biopolymer transport system component
MDAAPLAPRQQVGPYRLVAFVGRGGMGEVWSAKDTRLDRMVALKFASSSFTDRFAREARNIAALNHPNICTLFDVGPNFLVMELLEGRPLDQVIPRDGLRLGEALRYASEIADALAAAHAENIVHRDLKPSNVMITTAGRVKVLDFGLATHTGPVGLVDATASTAIGLAPSASGAIVGTVAYMSPEQAQGLPVDARSDIFSFGVLLYEMLTGTRPFAGDTSAGVLAAVINGEPRPIRTAADLPPELDRLVNRCLRKDPTRRPQTMADLHVALEDLREDSDAGRLSKDPEPAAPVVRSRSRRWPWSAALAGGVLAAGGAWWMTQSPATSAPPMTTARVTHFAGVQMNPALSPDGRQLAFAWNGERAQNFDIYVKLIGQSEALRITTDPASDTWPTWSPDGRQIAFRRADSIYTVSSLGGSEHRIASGLAPRGADGLQMSWAPDGRWLVVPAADGLFALAPDSGERRRATEPPGPLETDAAAAFSPDGRMLAFFRCGASSVSCRVLVQPLAADGTPAGAPRRLFERTFRVGTLAWSRDGHRVIFFGSLHSSAIGVLWQVDLTTGAPPERLVPTVAAVATGVSIAGDRLATGVVLVGAQVWEVRDGRPAQPFIQSAAFDFFAGFSPDGARVVFQSGRAGDGDQIFAADADGGGIVRLTGQQVLSAGQPAWSRDGKWLTFRSQQESGSVEIVVMASDGGPLRQLTRGHNNQAPTFSRDGSRVWFDSNRTGRSEIWSVPFGGGSERQFTTEGRRAAQESPDGAALYYLDGQSNLYRRPIGGGSERVVAAGVLSFLVVDDGLYLVRPAANSDHPRLDFTSLSGASSRVVSELPGYWVAASTRVSVSPDGRRILYTRYVPNNVIQMVDGFR